jgi:lipopolysaccharide/colanic/teichoic acid biosynthesis glycosyltransferase
MNHFNSAEARSQVFEVHPSVLRDAVIRVADVSLSALALIVLSPLLLAVMVVLLFTGEGDVFYVQQRIGRNRRSFGLLKFATMLRDSPNLGAGLVTLRDDPRVFPFGRFLRKSKLNEIPQLWNVLRGDMSLIGPRPLAQRHFELYPDCWRAPIASVRPGLSGLGSIVFRDEEEIVARAADPIKFYETTVAHYKGQLETWGIAHRSLGLYIKLILLTQLSVVRPGSDIARRVLPGLPDPPDELKL